MEKRLGFEETPPPPARERLGLKQKAPPPTRERLGSKKKGPPAARERLGLKKEALPPARERLGLKKEALPPARERCGLKQKAPPPARERQGQEEKGLRARRQLGYQENDGLCSQEEARMTVSMKRILAAAYPPENTAALVILAMAIVDKMDGNPYFPNPIPTLAKVTAAIDALRQAEAVSQSRMRGTVEVRNEARRKLTSLLTRLKAYEGPHGKPLLAARNGSVHGTVLLAVKAAAKLATYL